MELIAGKMKLIRTEANYTQDRMAHVIGVSKKTLVQIEKGRVLPNWTTVVTVCALFREQEILMNLVGGDALEIAELLAREEIDHRKEKTLGGKIWWAEIKIESDIKLQRNLISKHFRIIDDEQYRLFSTFNEQEAKARFDELVQLQRDILS
ncbi:helix-turn-helix transcriptional regulator [Jeotgalibacillus soli]